MRRFSFRPTFALRGRQFKGLRGWSGKPAHPPLTDFPIAAYLFAAVFDLIATFGRHESWARDFSHAGTFVFVGGAAVSLLTALTGFWDWLRSTEKGTQARRTANAHAWAMILVTVLALDGHRAPDRCVRRPDHPTPAILILSLVVAAARLVRRRARRHAGVRLRLQRRDGR